MFPQERSFEQIVKHEYEGGANLLSGSVIATLPKFQGKAELHLPKEQVDALTVEYVSFLRVWKRKCRSISAIEDGVDLSSHCVPLSR